jgi:signal transduction histidine kinase
MQAIYETGSKLTHDVKNILQSTKTMSQIINDNDAEMEEIFSVLKKQMPLLTQRLNTTLEKLRAPQKTELVTKNSHGSLQSWWIQLQQRYSDRGIVFSTDLAEDIEIPIEVFNTVMENLLDNARSKLMREPELQIFVKLTRKDNKPFLSVTDTGSAIDKKIAQQLFKEVVSSQDGYGIGLYQCYELARNNGYDLAVSNNTEGRVSFSLAAA